MKYLAITNCRVSSDKQLKNNSLNRQQASILKAAKRLGVDIPKDGQWSGSVSSKRGRNYYRKDIKEMLDYCKMHPRVKYLIVDEPDRFMRSIDEAFYWEVEFRERVGVQVYYACDDILNSDDITAKMMRFMKYLTAEGSNVERQHKSIEGDRKAIREGRYPFHPKLGYMKGTKPGIHKLAPEIGELMRNILTKLASGLLDLTDSLVEYNNSSYVKNGKHCPYKMDKWRKIVSDPYYAGILEMEKQISVRNENGLHEAIITREQHLKILEIVKGRKKNQCGPRKNGNPDFPLNTITLCEHCFYKELENGREGRKNRGKFVGFKHGNGRTDKVYKRYRCRICGRSILRDELHQNVNNFLKRLDFSEKGRKELEKALINVWKNEEVEIEKEICSLKNKIFTIQRIKDGLIEKLANVSSDKVGEQLEATIEQKIAEIDELEAKKEYLENSKGIKREEFISFALDFADNLASHFFELTPEEVKKCKLLIFPSGFFVDSENKVYTTQISPFYRLRETKKTPESADFDLMVRMKRL